MVAVKVFLGQNNLYDYFSLCPCWHIYLFIFFFFLQVATFSPAVGSRVWVEDQDEAWLDGEVVEINGEQIKVLCTSGKQVCAFHMFKSNNVCVCVFGFGSMRSFNETFLVFICWKHRSLLTLQIYIQKMWKRQHQGWRIWQG